MRPGYCQYRPQANAMRAASQETFRQLPISRSRGMLSIDLFEHEKMYGPYPAILPNVKKIAVLRPNGVGDFVFSLPALHALRSAYPDARITYIGQQWHADFFKVR